MHYNSAQRSFYLMHGGLQKMSTVKTSTYSKAEEIANSITHGLGAVLGVAGLVLLLVFSSLEGSASHVVSSAIYGSALIILYLASTLYHAIPSPRAKRFFQKLDHSSIFLLIAGTYTPITLNALGGPWGWSIFGTVWGLALIGIILELATQKRYKKISITLYLCMGWLIVIAVKPMIENVAAGGLILLLSGGLVYSLGIIFYLWKRCPFNHAIWHLFVLAGSILQFFAVFFYILP